MAYTGTTYVPGWEEWARQNPRAHSLYTNKPSFITRAAQGLASAGGFGRVGAAGARINAGLNRNYFGRSLKIGAMESLGFSFKGSMFGTRNLQNLGFLGTGIGAPGGMRAAFGDIRSPDIKSGSARTIAKSAVTGEAAADKMGRIRKAGGGARRFMGRAFSGALNLAFTAAYAYEGYQQEGMWGAAKGVGESILWSAGVRAVGGIIGGPVVGVGLAVAAVGMGGYALAEAGRGHRHRLRELELTAGPEIMNNIYGAGAVTMRQRSLLALQNTHINGRMAIGNEALLIHTPFR
jgi:hypothetical protein